jgi:hypothetical protein
MGRVLSLFDRTGVWAQPYRDRGDLVHCVDLSRGEDVRLIPYPFEPADVILAAVPCTEFAGSGARWWASKGDDALTGALSLLDATMRIIWANQPSVWAIENPVGRLTDYIGAPRFIFDPHEFAGWADEPDTEAYTKRTCLWGRFAIPQKRTVPPVLGSMMHKLPPSDDRADLRSVTPQGFSRAFAEANPAILDGRL